MIELAIVSFVILLVGVAFLFCGVANQSAEIEILKQRIARAEASAATTESKGESQ
jgi:hypothetical protein